MTQLDVIRCKPISKSDIDDSMLMNHGKVHEVEQDCELFFCNVSHRHDKISMKISKCAISKQHIQNGRPSRYQDENERKKCAKAEQKRKHVRKYREERRMRGKRKRIQQKKRSTKSECCAISPRRHPKVENDARGRVDEEP